MIFFSSRRRHTRWPRDWSSDVCSSDLIRKSLFEIADHPAEALYAHYRNKKFRNKHPNRDGHIILMRASETLLIQAESEARQGRISDAIHTLNELRQHRNLAPPQHSDFDKTSAERTST